MFTVNLKKELLWEQIFIINKHAGMAIKLNSYYPPPIILFKHLITLIYFDRNK